MSYFYARRLVLVSAIMWIQEFLVAQFFLFIFLLIANVMLLKYLRPYTEQFSETREVLNEVLIMFMAYHMFAFTDYIPDPILRHKIGISCLSFLALHLTFNLGLIFMTTCR